jgi:hypothetical protein
VAAERRPRTARHRLGARSIVAMFLSIHIGVLMDRFGTRKVTLFFVGVSIALAPLFPLVSGHASAPS